MTARLDRSAWVELGAVGKPRGLKGDVWLRAYNTDGGALRVGALVRVTLRDKSHRSLTIETLAPAGESLVARFEGVATREAAEALTGALLSVQRSSLAPLAPGEFYHCDLPGMRVVTEAGAPVGEVVRVEAYPTVDALVVKTDGGELELPITPDIVRSLDVDARVAVVDLSPLED